ncbi:MAG TPA: energy-coupling factor transporter transmembrane component T, partial [Nitriliruptorales bacterium]
IAAFMVRYLEVLAGEVRRLQSAMRARAFAPRWITDAAPVGAAAGTLFVRSYERSERVHQAMLARGFTGTMPELSPRPTGARRWLAALPLPAVAAAVAVIATVTS